MAFFPEDVAIEQIDVPYTATDFQPYCLTVRQAEAQAVMTAFNPQQIPTMMQTCNQLGLRDLTWVVPSSVITPEILDLMDEARAGQPLRAVVQLVRLRGPGRRQRGVRPEVGEVSNLVADQSVATWLGVKLLPQLVEGAGAVDAAAIRAWLDQQTEFDTGGATPLLDFTAQTIRRSRVKNVTPWGGEWADGTAQPDDEPLEIDFSVLAG